MVTALSVKQVQDCFVSKSKQNTSIIVGCEVINFKGTVPQLVSKSCTALSSIQIFSVIPTQRSSLLRVTVRGV